MDLFSVFDSPPLFNVRFGRQELGMVHELSFWRKREGGISLSLGGRSWKVGEIEWKNRIVYVEPSDERGQSIWLGESQWMSFELCRSIRSVLVDERVDSYWSKRAGERVDGIRREFAWLKSQGTTLMHDKGKNRSIWWTFAGMQVNVVLSEILAGVLKVSPDVDNNMIDFKTSIEGSDLRFALRNQIAKEIDFANFTVNDELVNRVKFRKAIPESIVIAMLRNRILNLENLDKVGAEIVSEISISI